MHASPSRALEEVPPLLSSISRSLSQAHAKAWVQAAIALREVAVTAGFDTIANRCRQLEKVTDVEHTHVATLIFEHIAEDYARLAATMGDN